MDIDLHGKNLYQARIAVSSALKHATNADYAYVLYTDIKRHCNKRYDFRRIQTIPV